MTRKVSKLLIIEVARRVLDGEKKLGSSRRRRAALIAHAARQHGHSFDALAVRVDALLREWREIEANG